MINKDVGIIINLGSGKRFEIIKYIVKILKVALKFWKVKLRNDEQLNLFSSVSFAKSKKLKQKIGILEV